MDTLIQNNIIVKKSAIHGYGVFATNTIIKDEIIETCYALTTNKCDPALYDYYFGHRERSLVLLGYGFIYNHSSAPNATYLFDEDKKIMIIKALKNITKNEEIFISYGKNWFSSRNLIVKNISWCNRILRYVKKTPLRIVIVLSGLLIITHPEYVSIVSMSAQKIVESLLKTIPRVINA